MPSSRWIPYLSGCLILANVLASDPQNQRNLSKEFLEQQIFPEKAMPERALIQTMRRYREMRRAQPEVQVQTVKCNIPVIAAKYSDTGSDPWPIENMQKQLFDGPWSTGTLRQYFREASYGQFDANGKVFGWYQLGGSASHYCPYRRYTNPCNFIHDLLSVADPLIDFGEYDSDGDDGIPNSGDDDGYVDVVFVISPGIEDVDLQEHFYLYSLLAGSAYRTDDESANGGNIRIDEYTVQNAIGMTGKMLGIKVFCHEMGHALGLPDLYDVDYSSHGIAYWGLMGYSQSPDVPSGMTAWSKVHLGWIIPKIMGYGIHDLEIKNSYQYPEAYLLPTVDPENGEYFLIENRQGIGFDGILPGSGLLIWHVDESRFAFGESGLGWNNYGNGDENHPGLDLEEAGDDEWYADDPFPGPGDKRTFGRSTRPGSHTYEELDSGISISKISDRKMTMTASVCIDPDLLNALLLTPMENEIHSVGEKIYFSGSAFGTTFHDYTIGVKRAGSSIFTPILRSNQPVYKDTLGEWYVPDILIDGDYIFRLTSYNDSRKEAYTECKLTIGGSFQKGWPVHVEGRLVAPSIVMADLDGDGQQEVIAGNASGFEGSTVQLYVWDKDGNLKNGWPRNMDGDRAAAPAVGDLDGDGFKDIVIQSGVALYVFHADGSLADGWPVPIGSLSSPVLGDLDADGDLEVIVTESSSPNVYVLDGRGSVLSGWPQATADAAFFTPSVADVDRDGDWEVFVRDLKDDIYAWHHDGTALYGWPVGSKSGSGRFEDYSPVIADLDRDGLPEILSIQEDHVWVYHADGSLMEGWPQFLNSPHGILPPSAVVVADMTGDGFPEVIATSQLIYIWDNTGACLEGWPKDVGVWSENTMTSPVIGDVDQDGKPDIVVVQGQELEAHRMDGEMIRGFPKKLPKTVSQGYWNFYHFYSPCISDLDGDGDMEIGIGAESQVHIYDLSVPVSVDAIPWPKFQHDNQNTGWYDFHPDGGSTETPEEKGLIPSFGLKGNAPNPFNSQTVIRYEIPEAGEVRIEVFNTLGQRVWRQRQNHAHAGDFELVWIAEDEERRALPSGVYIVRLHWKEEIRTAKIMLLR